MSHSAVSSPLRHVAIGGGTGLAALLQGLKHHILREPSPAETAAGRQLSDLTAVVTVTDDGGSSGRLRRELRVLPPGDIRNCMVALSEDEPLLSGLFQYRFSRGRGLKGHSFGNLFLAALTRITGDFAAAVKLSSEVLAIRGRIFPSTLSNVTLEAQLADGQRLTGETRIGRARSRIRRIRLAPHNCRPLPETLEALAAADVITLGPGSLFTSLVPNVLVKGFAEAMAASRAVKIFLCNIMTQPGETRNFTAADHIRAIYSHCGIPLFDYAVLNTGAVSPALLRRYRKQRSEPVVNDVEAIRALGVRPVTTDLVAEDPPAGGHKRDGFVRHDPERLARLVLELGSRGRRRALAS